MNRGELDTVLAWAAAEGWNPGRHDAEAFWAADPEGYYGMEVNGELIGSASIVTYAGRLAFLGLYIVRPGWRGLGLGAQFAGYVIEQLQRRRVASAALDGVFAMQEFYARQGFVFSHRNLRMEGVGVAGAPDAGLESLTDLPWEDVLSFDRAHFGVEREDFLRRWINPPGGLGLACVRGGRIAGLGVTRPCLRGYKIGPLFADDATAAEALFTALSNHAAGEPFFLDIPENNPDAVALAGRHGLKECFGCARMVWGAPLALPWQRIFGVTSFELG